MGTFLERLDLAVEVVKVTQLSFKVAVGRTHRLNDRSTLIKVLTC